MTSYVCVSLSTWRGLRLGMPDVEAPVATIAAIEDEVIVMNALVRLLLHVRFVLGRPVKLAAEIRHTLDVDEFIVDALFVSDVCIRRLVPLNYKHMCDTSTTFSHVRHMRVTSTLHVYYMCAAKPQFDL